MKSDTIILLGDFTYDLQGIESIKYDLKFNLKREDC